ncbi:hypothetical protein ASPZODRAFT_147347 [Penicilliopsis zonata CBS 506.65]|uniref:Nucleoside phosphorylase domain-containing protein n=1 Tax=Penicilliopsis zonata CBS 506.65 TaxID=1073090 RepID=A0A1L9S5D8_9EURO|nr:hypothetical protein ASPZODRAFT_147347 [Penicilliopsis zonata CBS 506.65]OJJ42360.1 hypothetical protein ASPZODRAFT_147347 [Penicilliopsis zonata CBS 506.65]
MSDPKIYTIAWICAVSTDYVAARAFLDEEHEGPADNKVDYTLGKVGKHNVVIFALPLEIMEKYRTSAAQFAVDMLLNFPNIRICLMVSIGGGAPSADNDIRLGDIVVGIPSNGQSGVIQYDYGKTIQGQSFQPTGFTHQPPTILRAAVHGLQARYELHGNQLDEAVNEVLKKRPRLREKYKRPESDRLYQSQVVHLEGDASNCAIDCGNDSKSLVLRTPRSQDDENPTIHYGLIASSNVILKDAIIRDEVAAEMGVLCFQMGAAGMMNGMPCLTICGIYNYSDSHKNREWQGYASMVAAAYAKDLLCQISPQSVESQEKDSGLLKPDINRLTKLLQDLDESKTESIRSMDDGPSREPELGDPSAANHSQQNPEVADPKVEEPAEDYPPSAAAKTATETSARSQGVWSSRDARETVNVSTMVTSVEPGALKMDQDLADNESIYTSDAPRSLAYVRELARSFFKDSELPDVQSLERIHKSLPDLLRGFAQRIGGESHVSTHFEVMKFVIKRRVDIASSFGKTYLDDKDTLQRRKSNDMPLDELFSRWPVDQEMGDPNIATPRPDDVLSTEDDSKSDAEGDDDVDDLQLEMYRNVVANSTAFQWLLYRLNREISLTTSEASSMKAISTQIRQMLYTPLTLFDKSKATAWVETSGCLSLEAAGVVETLVEVGEVFAFIVAALRSARGDSVAYVTPTIDSGLRNSDQTCKFFIHLQHSDGYLRSIGQCWQDLFRNPVVVLGFPVRRRQPDQGPGLEVSLATLAALVGTKHIAVFCGKIFLHGFCTILVPTKYAGDTVHWHVLFNEDGSRIPFTDFRVRRIVTDFDLSKHLTLSGVENARHIVGWCEHVRNYAGLPQPDSRFAFDRVSVSVGKIVSMSGSVAIGKKEKPARAAKTTDYHKQIEWAEERFVVLYDCKDRRAWLIDGLSALLHLVRARLAHRRKVGREVLFAESDIKEPDIPYTGKAAATYVLRNRANMDLKICEKWNRRVEETSKTGGEPPETTLKTQRTWEQLPDLVGDIYTILGMLCDIQSDTLTMDGFGAKVHISPRRRLEGWDFRQVATGADPLLPKAASLRDIGLGWVDLIRTINAITLFGIGFGEIIQPVDTAQALVPGRPCGRWATLPKGEDLLATTTPVIRDIMESVYRGSDNQQRFRELSTGIYWHSPDRVFEDCHCGDAPDGIQCDRVQVLLPTKFPNIFARGFHSPPEPLPTHGAVVFGHSIRFPLIWKSEAFSAPIEGDLQPTKMTSHSSRQSDSGLGTSVASSPVHGESTSQVSILGPASSGSTHGGAASVTGSEGTTTSGKGKSAQNIIKRLFKKTRPGRKSVETSRDPGRS